MLVKFRKEHPFLFVICVGALFLLTVRGLGNPLTDVIMGLMPGQDTLADNLGTLAIEIVLALEMLVILHLTDRMYLITKKGRGFFSGLAIGGYCFGFLVYMTVVALVGGFEEGPIDFTAASVVYVLSMLVVGIAEEFEARAIIAETLLEHFGTARKGALCAAGVSGLIFGLMHLSNAIGGSFAETLPQVILCISGGILYGVIYYRSGNIWSIALIHGINDVVASISEWLFAGGVSAASDPSATLSVSQMIFTCCLAAIEIGVSLYLMRKKRADEVKETWSDIPEDPKALTEAN